MFNLEVLKEVIKQRVADALGIQQSDPMVSVYKQKMQKWHNKYQAERKLLKAEREQHQDTKSWLDFRLLQLNILSEEIESLTEQLDRMKTCANVGDDQPEEDQL